MSFGFIITQSDRYYFTKNRAFGKENLGLDGLIELLPNEFVVLPVDS